MKKRKRGQERSAPYISTDMKRNDSRSSTAISGATGGNISSARSVTKQMKTGINYGFILGMGCIFAVGAALRFYMLPEQILIDDEWHGINFVINKSFWDILTGFETSDNSSPLLNLYYLFLYHTVGWSEFTVRFPALVAGLSSLLIFPFQLKKIFNERVALCFACLMAISPFLIFYSRFARVYSIMALLCFWFLLLIYQWFTSGNNRYAVASIVVGILSVYAHLFSLPTVLAPLVAAIAVKASTHFNKSARRPMLIMPSLRRLFLVTIILISLSSLVLLPALLRISELPWARGTLTLQSFFTAATLISGTSNPALTVLFFLFAIGGMALLFKQNSLLGGIFVAVVCFNIVALLVARPNGTDAAIVLLRYMIVVLPIALNGVAVMADSFLLRLDNRLQASSLIRIFSIIIVAAFMGLWFVAGPLPETYASAINFTNHSTFQGSYEPHTFERSEGRHVYPSFSVKQDQIPVFYHWLKDQKQVHAIIEYPYDICNYNNLYYYYQYVHRKKVIAGYCMYPNLLGYALQDKDNSSGERFTLGVLSVDNILDRVADPHKLLFRNMIDINDITAIQKSRADFIILHKFIMALKIMPDRMGTIPVYYKSVAHYADYFTRVLGPPVFEDSEIVCFRLTKQE